MKKLFLVAIAVIGFAVIAHASAEEATDCAYTGNSSDYCYASSNDHNYKVPYCQPGTTDCYYFGI